MLMDKEYALMCMNNEYSLIRCQGDGQEVLIYEYKARWLSSSSRTNE